MSISTVRTVRLLLEARADINACDHRQMTPLMDAVGQVSEGAVSVQLSEDYLTVGMLQAKNTDGRTAYDLVSAPGGARGMRKLLVDAHRRLGSISPTLICQAMKSAYISRLISLAQLESIDDVLALGTNCWLELIGFSKPARRAS